MLRFGSRLVLGFSVLALLACGPSREGFDASLPDVPAMDVPVDTSVDVETSVDARDALVSETSIDGPTCNDDACDTSCVQTGCLAGVCRDNACSCRGCPDVVGRDVVDVQYESSVVGCMVNTDCPPSEFCSGIGCSARGFCFPRGETDAATCAPDPAPSCGCDGVSYSSVCARLSAGVRQNPAGCGGDAAVDVVHTDVLTDVHSDVHAGG